MPRLLLPIVIALVLLSPGIGRCNETAPPSPPAPAAPAESTPDPAQLFPALKELGIEAERLAELEAGLQSADPPAALTEDHKSIWSDRRREALKLLDSAQQQLTRAAKLQHDAKPEEVQRKLDELRATLNAPPPEPNDLSESTLAELEQRAATKQQEIATHQERFAKAENELKRRSNRRAEIPRAIAAATIRLEEIEQHLAAMPGEVPEELRPIQRTFLLSEKLARRAEIECLQRELQKYDATGEVVPLQHDCAARDLSRDEKELKQLRELIAQRRKSEAERSAREARLALLQALGADPRVREIAQQNADLADERRRLAELQQQRAQDIEREKRRYAPVLRSFEDLRERAELADSADRAALLHAQLRLLPDESEFRAKIKELTRELGPHQLAYLEYQSEWSRLADLNREIEELLSDDLDRPELLDQALRQHLENKRANVDALRQASEQYIGQLTELQSFWEEAATTARDFREYIAERILWAPSTAPFRLTRLASGHGWEEIARSVQSAAGWLLAPANWRETAHLLQDDALQFPLLWALATLLCGGLILVRPRLRARVRHEGEVAERKHTDVMRPTVIAMIATLGLTLVWLSGPAFVGWRLLLCGALGSHGHALGAGLLATLVVCAPLELLRQACRASGLADSHFDWPRRSISLLRKSIRRLTLPSIALVLISTMLHSHAAVTQPATRGWSSRISTALHLDWNDSVGRMAFMLLMLVIAWFIQKIMRPGSGVFEETLAAHQGGWLDRLRWLWYPVSVGAPLALAGLAAAGYYYTATQLAWRLAATLDLVLGLVLIHALLLRWLLVLRRRLAMEQARQRRAALLESREAGETAEPALEPERVDLAIVNQQSRHLLQSALVCAAMIGMTAVWIDVLPALKKLNEYHLTRSDITVGNLLMAGLLAMMTFLAARNIPGLLEISILQRLPLEPGSGYAITTICRYATVVIGAWIISRQLHVHWNEVQWLVAAMSVGLGFGLQEIFGNFMSGLIILFERPVRVGDVITVGQVTGCVSRIRMRATTIIDPDRKELIVPNKEFITGQVVNWTLSDSTLRLALRVQVEYPCDPSLVQKLMLKAAQDHPNVLAEPTPNAYFEEVREHSLQFVLWVFLPSLSVIARTRHELLTAITAHFQAAGIELAFPVRELQHLILDAGRARENRRSA